jgi:putative DNA primase/helicase
MSYAFWRRWILVEFPNRFEGNNCNKNILDEIDCDGELEGLLNKAIDSFEKVLENNEFTISKSIEAAKNEWMKKANSVYGFVTERIDRDIEGAIEKDIVWDDYLEYCNENDFVSCAKNAFSTDFQRLANAKASMRRIDGKQKKVWLGIKLRLIKTNNQNFEKMQKFLTGVV